jgi:hypothetical protein
MMNSSTLMLPARSTASVKPPPVGPVVFKIRSARSRPAPIGPAPSMPVKPQASAVQRMRAKPPKPRRPSPAAEAMRERADRTRVDLARRFPACFVPKGAPTKPLLIGIAEQLYAACRDLDRHDLANMLANYTSEASYYQATIAGAERIDLSGAVVGIVKASAAEFALKQIAKLIGQRQ